MLFNLPPKILLLHPMCLLLFVQIVHLAAFAMLVQCEHRDTLPLVGWRLCLLCLLWRSAINPPFFLQVRACLMLKLFPHVQVLGVRDNGQPYLILRRSQNSCVLSIYPSSSIGRVDSYVEAPCSLLISFSLHCWLVSLDFISVSFCWLYSCLSHLIFFLMLFIVSFWIL